MILVECMTSPAEVRRQIVPDLRSSCTGGFVGEVGRRRTDEQYATDG